MPSPLARRKATTGSGPSHLPATTTGTLSSPGISPVSSPKFTNTYNLATVSDILITAGLEIPLDQETTGADLSLRMSALIMINLKRPSQWTSAKAFMLSDAGICAPLESALVLTTMCHGLESLSLMSSQDRFLTVDGSPVPIEKDESDLRKDANDLRSKFARAIQCPGIPSGASS